MKDGIFKPGDRAMLVSILRYRGGDTNIKPVTIATVRKTGHVLIEGSKQMYRSDGTRAGKHSGWQPPPRLEPWSDAKWQDFQRREARDAAAHNISKLSDNLAAISRDREAAAELWESLPYSVRSLIDDAPQQ